MNKMRLEKMKNKGPKIKLCGTSLIMSNDELYGEFILVHYLRLSIVLSIEIFFVDAIYFKLCNEKII